ncbi:MAG TPA: GNAT family N-acetyltransferase [Paenibacillus sp.]|jgi:N-acetylglutamate synthase-like GNAT family acetyltransferase
MNDFIIRELTLEDLHPDLLNSFNRYQEVQRCWRMENGEWILKNISFTEQWEDSLKQEIVDVDFTNCLESGGFVWGVFNNNNEVIAFASMPTDFFGSENQYLQLMQIHVSYEYRNKGMGRELFALCSEKARQLGAKKLYISTHSSEESQHFYKKVGCVDAEEINKKLAEYEPYDRQMELIL